MFRRFRIEGHSMEPSYKMGSSVVVWRSRHFREGDVIAFRLKNDQDRVLIKRISKRIGDDTFEVAGDNKVDSLDVGLIDRDEIIGRVVLSY